MSKRGPRTTAQPLRGQIFPNWSREPRGGSHSIFSVSKASASRLSVGPYLRILKWSQNAKATLLRLQARLRKTKAPKSQISTLALRCKFPTLWSNVRRPLLTLSFFRFLSHQFSHEDAKAHFDDFKSALTSFLLPPHPNLSFKREKFVFSMTHSW